MSTTHLSRMFVSCADEPPECPGEDLVSPTAVPEPDTFQSWTLTAIVYVPTAV